MDTLDAFNFDTHELMQACDPCALIDHRGFPDLFLNNSGLMDKSELASCVTQTISSCGEHLALPQSDVFPSLSQELPNVNREESGSADLSNVEMPISTAEYLSSDGFGKLVVPLHASPFPTDDQMNHLLKTSVYRTQAIQRYRFKKAIKYGAIPINCDLSTFESLPPAKYPRVHRNKCALRAAVANRRPRIRGRFLKKEKLQVLEL